MIFNAGYKYNRATKAWMAAFLMNAVAGAAFAAPPDQQQQKPAETPHYTLLTLNEVEQRETAAYELQDTQAFAAYEAARLALQQTKDGVRATPNDLPPDLEKNSYIVDNLGQEYHVIDPDGDVDWTEFFIAQKTAQVKAEKVEPGTHVKTIMRNGLVESEKIAGPNGGYRVTNPTGEQYLVDTAKFEKIYDALGDGVFAPKPDPRKVLPTNENVSFVAPWGAPMFIREGGVLVHETHRKVYGIQPDEYKETYSPV